MSPLSSLLNGKSPSGLDAERKQEETQENAFFPFLFIFLSLNVLADVLLASNNRRICLTEFLKSLECSPGDTKIMGFKIQILFTSISDLGFLFLLTSESRTDVYIFAELFVGFKHSAIFYSLI